MIKKEQVSPKYDINATSSDLEGNVDINDLKQLVTSLGESQPVKTKYSLTSFPKPSCGRLSEDSDEESPPTKDQRKVSLKKKASKSSELNKLTKLMNRTKHSIPSLSSASEQSHFYGIPDFVNSLTSYESVKRSIQEIIRKLTKKVKRSPCKQTNELTKKPKDDQNEKLDSEHTIEVVKPLKRKRSLGDTSTDSNLQPKIKKIGETRTNLFTKIEKEEEKPVIKEDLKVFGSNLKSNLNPYRSVSLTACSYRETNVDNTLKSKSDSAIKDVRESDSFKNSHWLKNTKTNSTKNISAGNSKSLLNSDEKLLETQSNKAGNNKTEHSESNLKVDKIIKQETVCETSLKVVDTEDTSSIRKTDASIKSAPHQNDSDSVKKETEPVMNNNPFHDILTLIRKEDKPTEDQIIQNISKARERMFSIAQKDLTPQNEVKSAVDEDFHFCSEKKYEGFLKINCTANFSPVEQPFHDLLTLKRKSEHVEDAKKTELSKESLDAKPELAEKFSATKKLIDTYKTFSRKRRFETNEGTHVFVDKRLKTSKSFTGLSCVKPRKSLRRSKSCSFILSEPNRSNIEIDFSKPLKTDITFKNDLSSLEGVENKSNLKTATSENIESCCKDEPMESSPHTSTDFPPCSTRAVESKTNKAVCESETSQNKREKELPVVKG